MHEIFILSLFLIDAALVAASAWLALCAVGGQITGKLDPLLGWGLMAVAVVAGSGVVLGLTGTLSRGGFLAAHAASLLFLLIWRRDLWRDHLQAARTWLLEIRRYVGAPTGVSRAAAAMVLLVLALAALAAPAEPMVHDTLAYRLPRIGLWLNEGRIFHFDAADPRLNYMPWVPDLITTWLLGATSDGWRLIALMQTFGGGLLLVATITLARQAGLNRGPALGAAALVLGLANVAVQFTSSQTDVFTAGILTAAFSLWQGALLRSRGSAIAGVGAALALGSKGTVFYVAPGLLIVVTYLLFKHRIVWHEWRRTLFGAAAAGLLLVLPAYAMNIATYGGTFGPEEAVRLHHGPPDIDLAERMEKLWLNLRTSAIQLFDPSSQPAGLRKGAMRAGNVLLQNLPQSEDEPYAFANYSRHYSLQNVLNHLTPDVDVLSCGLLAVLSFAAAAGTLLSSARTTVARPLLLAGTAAVVVYILFQHAVVQWHPWTFRFMALAAPWWAVTVAAGLEAWPRRLRLAGWLVMLAASANVFWHVTVETPQAGWLALTQPRAPFDVYQGLRRWSEKLDSENTPLLVALEANRPLAAFFRQSPSRPVHLRRPVTESSLTAETIVGESDRWLVAPLEKFQGREGRVRAQTLIFFGPLSPNSVAAYRSLRSGERPVPVLYRNQRVDTKLQARRSLLVRVWDAEPVRLQLYNPRAEPCRWHMNAPEGEYEGELTSGGTAEVTLPLPADSLIKLVFDFSCPPGGPAPAVAIGSESVPR